jgi:hypothetical protein
MSNFRGTCQEKEIRKIVDNTQGMYGDFQSVTGRSLPQIKSLELPPGEIEELEIDKESEI